MSYLILNAVMAAVVFAGAACRLGAIKPSEPGIKHRISWALWLWSHVLLGVGAFGVMVSPFVGYAAAHNGNMAILLSLAMIYILRWVRNAGEPIL